MLSFLIILILILYLLPCIATSRLMSIMMLKDNYSMINFAIVLGARTIGSSFGVMYFKDIFDRIGTFRLLTFSIVMIVECILGIFNFANLEQRIVLMFLFGFFEYLAGCIIKPLLSEFHIYLKQVDLLIYNFVRLVSGLFLIFQQHNISHILVCLVLFTLLIYIFSELRNKFKKDYVQAHDVNLLLIYEKYNEYFFTSLLNHACNYINLTYLASFLSGQKIIDAASYLTIYILGQVVFSYPLLMIISPFKGKRGSLVISFLYICIYMFNFYSFQDINAEDLYTIDTKRIISVGLLGGISSITQKYRLKELNSNDGNIPVDITEDQLKNIGSIIGIIVALIMIKTKISLWIVCSFINVISISHIIIRKIFFDNKTII